MGKIGTSKHRISIGAPAKAALDDLREVTMRNAQFRKDIHQAIEQTGYIVWKGRKLRIVDDATGLQSNEIRFGVVE